MRNGVRMNLFWQAHLCTLCANWTACNRCKKYLSHVCASPTPTWLQLQCQCLAKSWRQWCMQLQIMPPLIASNAVANISIYHSDCLLKTTPFRLPQNTDYFCHTDVVNVSCQQMSFTTSSSRHHFFWVSFVFALCPRVGLSLVLLVPAADCRTVLATKVVSFPGSPFYLCLTYAAFYFVDEKLAVGRSSSANFRQASIGPFSRSIGLVGESEW